MTTDLVIGMAGAGGDGVVSAGESLIAAAARQGYHGIMTKSFGSQIRGGESSCRVRLSVSSVPNPGGALDLAVAFNWDDFLRFGAELPVDGRSIVVYDARTGVLPERLPIVGVSPRQALATPIAELSKDSAGSERSKNAVVLGLLSRWLGLERDAVLAGLAKRLARRGAEVVEAGRRAFEAGAAFAESHPLARELRLEPPAAAPETKWLADGNEMCAAAAILAGCRFFSGYPITPSTEIMQFLSRELWKYQGCVLQAEDEIAGIGAALGASFAGRKAMTATSGPGMSLKAEILGLATIAELPLVVVDVQRGGPSTGIPTKSEQSDLFQACFSAHGDVVRPVLAPTRVSDTLDVTIEAFNIAERYQTPVVVLSDQEIAQRKETVDPVDPGGFGIEERRGPTPSELKDYLRFRVTQGGVSPISHPGLPGGNYLAAGIEHNERGDPTASGLVHSRMNEKRIRKLDPLKRRRGLFRTAGDPDAPLALLSWGSCAGVCEEALQRAQEEGLRVKLLVPLLLYPVAEDVYRDFLRGAQAGLVVEQSHQGQLYRLLRMFVELPAGIASFARSGANPFQPAEVVARLREAALALQRVHALALQPQE
jgi:2-oxoglutarate ferredoxin oxidoreductase subunit alpha